LRRQVRALKRAARAIDEEAPGKSIPALLADDVHLRATGVRFAKPARQTEHHFLRVADLGDVGGHAHALVAGTHAVDLDLSLVPASAVDLEHVEDATLSAADIIALDVDRRDECDEAAVLSGRGECGYRLAADYLLGARARDVDDRRFAA